VDALVKCYKKSTNLQPEQIDQRKASLTCRYEALEPAEAKKLGKALSNRPSIKPTGNVSRAAKNQIVSARRTQQGIVEKTMREQIAMIESDRTGASNIRIIAAGDSGAKAHTQFNCGHCEQNNTWLKNQTGADELFNHFESHEQGRLTALYEKSDELFPYASTPTCNSAQELNHEGGSKDYRLIWQVMPQGWRNAGSNLTCPNCKTKKFPISQEFNPLGEKLCLGSWKKRIPPRVNDCKGGKYRAPNGQIRHQPLLRRAIEYSQSLDDIIKTSCEASQQCSQSQ